ncbi:MAG: HEAT repeat domain-containing protein [Fibrobacterales bacterium]
MKWYSYASVVLILVQSLWASMETALPNIPTAELLGHGMYQVKGQLSYGTINKEGNDETIYPYNTGVYFGLFNRGEVGINYGRSVSLFLKAQILREETFLPSLSFGAQDVLASREAHFYGVPDSVHNDFEGQVFVALTKNILGMTKFHTGVTIAPDLNQGSADMYVGVEQTLLSGFSIDIEAYQRKEKWHQSLGLSWRYHNDFRISVGMAEVTEWFYQNEEIGFYTSAEPTNTSLFNTPTLYASISISGWMKEDETSTMTMQLDQLEQKQKAILTTNDNVTARLNRAEEQLLSLVGPKAEEMRIQEKEIESIIKEIIALYKSPAYDPKKIQSLQDSILSFKDASIRTLTNLTEQQTIDPDFRIHAIKIVGYSKSAAFVPPLKAALRSTHTEVKREAIFALSHIGTRGAYNAIKPMTQDSDLQVVETAKQVLGSMDRSTVIDNTISAITTSDDATPSDTLQQPLSLEELNVEILRLRTEVDSLKTVPTKETP